MDVNEQIRKFQEFIESRYLSAILENMRREKLFVVIDFSELSVFDPELANLLLDEPTEVIKSAELSIEGMELLDGVKGIRVRFKNVPESQKVMIKDIRSKLLNKLIIVDGLVKQKSDVRPQVTLAKFECAGCGNILSVYQVDTSFKEPTKCSCGKKGRFKLLDKELVDAQGIVLEESPEDLEGGEQPKRMNIFLKADLVSPLSEKKTNPGSKISVLGITREVPMFSRTGTKTTTFDLLIEANNVDGSEESFGEIKLTEEQKKEVLELSRDPKVYEKLASSIAPSIYGHEKVKEALILQLMGGVRKKRTDGVITRGDIHILLVGDPGAGKCVAGDTLIHLDDGSKKAIKTLAYEKRRIMALDLNLNIVPAKKESFYEREAEELLKINLVGGKEIKLTPEHPLLTKQGWKEAVKLVLNEEIAVEEENEIAHNDGKLLQVTKLKAILSWDKILRIEKLKGKFKVYDICVPEFHNFIANGIIVHNSQLLKRIAKVAPRARYVGGKGVSAAGLTASVVRDEFLKGWSLEAGALALTNGGHCLIDELDKMSHEDRDAMHEALEQQTISISKANIQACYSEDTEVLTNNGWKSFLEVGRNKIAQYDTKQKNVKFLPHKGLFVYDYEGEMYHYNNKRLDILVTPDHKMLAREFSHAELSEIKAKDLSYNYIKFINSAIYESKETNYFILPAGRHQQNRKHEKYTHQHHNKKVPMGLWLEFLGYYVTEGGLQRNPAIGITQKAGPSANKIRSCLEKLSKVLGFKLSETKYGKYIRFQIANTQLFQYLEKNCGENSKNKKLPVDFSMLSKNQLKILFNSMMLGDGASTGKAYSSSSKSLINSFQALALLVGKSASQHIQYPDKYRGNRVEHYRVVLSDKTEPSIRKRKIRKVNYKGKVFCFETKTGFFITRRNGKVAIQGNTLRAETTVLAAANPKFGRFAPYDPIAKQIDLPPTLISRFDLIFPIKDLPDETRDANMAEFILRLHKDSTATFGELPTEIIKNYIAYARQNIKPALLSEALEEIKDYYVKMRSMGKIEGEIVTIPITARQLEALVRMAEASAKTRFSKEVTRDDAMRAISLLDHCLRLVGMDKETGQLDIDRIGIGIAASQRNKIQIVRKMIEELEEKTGKDILVNDVIEHSSLKGVSQDEVEEIIEKLKRLGDIYEPTRGKISRVL